MNAEDDKGKTPEPTDPPGRRPSPKPANLGLALLFFGGMMFNIWADSQSTSYDGKYAVPIFAILIAGVLGFDLYKFTRGGGGS